MSFPKLLVNVILISLFLGSLLKVYSQSTVIDSLEKSHRNHNTIDSTLVNLKISLGIKLLNADPYRTFDLANSALDISEAIYFDKGTVESYSLIGGFYWATGDYSASLNYYLKALERAKSVNYKIGIAKVYNNIAEVYARQNEFEKSLNYHLMALDYKLRELPNILPTVSYSNIGDLYFKLGKFDEAKAYFNKVLENTRDNDNRQVIAFSTIGLGNIHVIEEEYPSAEQYYKLAIVLGNQLKDNRILANAYNEHSKLFLHTELLDSAKVYFQKAENYAYEINAFDLMANIYKTGIDIHESLEEYEQALEISLKLSQMQDSLYQSQKIAELARLEKSHESQASQIENELLKKDNEIKINQLRNQTLLFILTGVTLFLMVVVVFVIYRQRVRRTRENKILKLKNKEILEHKEELEAKTEQLIEIAKELSAQKDLYQDNYESIKLLGEIGAKITSSKNIPELTSKVYSEIKSLLVADIFSIGLLNSKTNALDFIGNIEKGNVLENYCYYIHEDTDRITVISFNHKRIIFTNDLFADFPNYPNTLFGRTGGHPNSVIVIPLVYSNVVIGVLIVCGMEKGCYNDYHLQLLQNLANYVTTAVINIKNYQRLEKLNLDLKTQKDHYKADYESIKALSDIGASITSTLNFSEIIKNIYVSVNNLMPAEAFTFGIYNPINNRIEFTGGMENGETLDDFYYDLSDNSRLAVKCFILNELIFTNDLETDYPNYPDPIEGEQPKSMIYVPLVNRKRSIGVLSFQSFKKNAFNDLHVSIIKNLVAYIGIALDNAQTFEKLERKSNENEILYELSNNLIQPISLEDLLQNVINAAVAIVPKAQTGTICLLNKEKTELVGTVSLAISKEALKKVRFKIGEGQSGRAVAEKRNIIENHVQEDHLVKNQLSDSIYRPIKSIIVVLLRVKEEIIGTLTVDNNDEENAFKQTDLEVLASLSANASVAIERVTLRDKLEKSFNQILDEQSKIKKLTKHQNFLQATIEMMRNLMGKTDLNEIAWYITKTLISIFDLEDCVIYILKENKCVQVAAAGPKNYDHRKVYNPITVELGDGIVGSVAKTGNSEIIPDTSIDVRYISDDKIRYSELSVAIISNNRVIGVIDSEHSTKNFFTTEHLNTFTDIADLVSIMLENALLLQEQKEKENKLELEKNTFKKQKEEYKTSFEAIQHISQIEAEVLSSLSSETKSDRINKILTDILHKNVGIIIPGESIYFGLYNEKINSLVFAPGIEQGRKINGYSYEIVKDKERIPVVCFNTSNTVVINNMIKEFPDYPRAVVGEIPKSMIATPIIINSNKIGVICAISMDENTYNELHVSILENLAAFIGIAIANANALRELEYTNVELSESFTQLKELDEYKEAMTGMIVHDFKNSLNTVINFSEGEPTKRRMKSIRQAGQFMLNMVMNILDVQKFEAAKPNLSLANYSLNKIINEALEQLSYMIEQKAINVYIKLNSEFQVRVDFELITRTLINIVGNAVKYVPTNGEIEIYTELIDSRIQLNVKDNGPGIPTDKLKTVFDKYSQINARRSGNIRSTGIGLTFCKMVVEGHGCEIGVESQEGKGSTFHFTMPLVDEKPTPDTNYEPISNLEGNTIELTETDKIILTPYLKKLNQWEVYDYSDVMTIVNNIMEDSQSINAWKEGVIKALQTGNEQRFNQLINQEQ